MTVLSVEEGWTFRPFTAYADVTCFDIYDPEGQWHGSRSSVEACEVYVDWQVHGDEKLAALKAQEEDFKARVKQAKDARTEKTIADAGDEVMIDLQSTLSHICAEHADKAAAASKNPKAQDWFVGQLLKTRVKGSVSPVVVKKVVTEWFSRSTQSITSG